MTTTQASEMKKPTTGRVTARQWKIVLRRVNQVLLIVGVTRGGQ
jgi:hypothetical protein